MSIKRRWSCEGSFLRRLPNFFLTLHQPDVTPASLPAFVLSSFLWVHYAPLRMLAWVHTALKFPLISLSLLCKNTILPHVTFTSHLRFFVWDWPLCFWGLHIIIRSGYHLPAILVSLSSLLTL